MGEATIFLYVQFNILLVIGVSAYVGELCTNSSLFLSLQGSFHSEHPWKTEIACPSGAKECLLLSRRKTMPLSRAKGRHATTY